MTGRTRVAAWDVAYGVAFAAGVLVFLVADLVPLRRFFLMLLTWVVMGGFVVFASGFAPKPRSPARQERTVPPSTGAPMFSQRPVSG